MQSQLQFLVQEANLRLDGACLIWWMTLMKQIPRENLKHKGQRPGSNPALLLFKMPAHHSKHGNRCHGNNNRLKIHATGMATGNLNKNRVSRCRLTFTELNQHTVNVWIWNVGNRNYVEYGTPGSSNFRQNSTSEIGTIPVRITKLYRFIYKHFFLLYKTV